MATTRDHPSCPMMEVVKAFTSEVSKIADFARRRGHRRYSFFFIFVTSLRIWLVLFYLIALMLISRLATVSFEKSIAYFSKPVPFFNAASFCLTEFSIHQAFVRERSRLRLCTFLPSSSHYFMQIVFKDYLTVCVKMIKVTTIMLNKSVSKNFWENNKIMFDFIYCFLLRINVYLCVILDAISWCVTAIRISSNIIDIFLEIYYIF